MATILCELPVCVCFWFLVWLNDTILGGVAIWLSCVANTKYMHALTTKPIQPGRSALWKHNTHLKISLHQVYFIWMCWTLRAATRERKTPDKIEKSEQITGIEKKEELRQRKKTTEIIIKEEIKSMKWILYTKCTDISVVGSTMLVMRFLTSAISYSFSWVFPSCIFTTCYQ